MGVHQVGDRGHPGSGPPAILDGKGGFPDQAALIFTRGMHRMILLDRIPPPVLHLWLLCGPQTPKYWLE